ncbi:MULTISPECIES: type IV secretory system conjugative DNA transfer family protein [Streptomycetaceae]|uniref:type IV secretory system conjugative DNA transfer family protein n=1 Tax=Streptomycetaceae TaxID=2062 RepID=UPI0009400ECA|nr:type IV secretory system conjugative DNA transfer family protein [Streptomyces sp. CB02056]
MTTDNTAQAQPAARNPAVEKRFAAAQVAAPLLVAAGMPFLDPQAATTVSTFLAAPVLVAGATAAGLLSDGVLDALPGGDILRAHRIPFAASAVATATAAATATLNGTVGIDALVAGWMTMPSLPGFVSVAWWSTVGFVGWALRPVLGSSRRRKARPAPPAADPGPARDARVEKILGLWDAHISGEYGAHTGQHLTLHGVSDADWDGLIQAAPGRPVTVTPETVSGTFRIPAEWITVADGPHASSKRIVVRLTAPTPEEFQHGDLERTWLKRVARSGGCMPGTHLEGLITDPATGGVAAWICADEDTDALSMPDPTRLAGALHKTTLLVSVEATDDPRRAILRVMERSPLEDGRPLPGAKALVANDNGFVTLGTGVSGKPARIQLFDEKGGARHVLVAGVTGSGKGGVLQLIALSYHVNGVAIIYADPKGSSNPDIEDMAAYAGCGREGAMGSLRLAYALLQHRIAESQSLRAKNFTASAERPFVALILDEFAQLLGEKSPYRAEAAMIIAAIAEQGRSLGICLVLCGQILNLDKMGGDTAVRDNVFYGGALILLRSDSSQTHRVDLPDSFDGIDPSKIPAFWKKANESLIYDPDLPEDDPRRTFGLGYVVGPDERAEMMRAWIQESAAGLWDPEAVAVPLDFPDWADRDLIAATPVGAGTDGALGPDLDDWTPAETTRTAPAREPTAEEKILRVLGDRADPIGLDIGYVHIDDITSMTGVSAKTVANKLTDLVKARKVVRNPDRAGEYGLPLLKNTDQDSLPEPSDSL